MDVLPAPLRPVTSNAGTAEIVSYSLYIGPSHSPPFTRFRLTCDIYDMTQNILQSSMMLSTPASFVCARNLASSVSPTLNRQSKVNLLATYTGVRRAGADPFATLFDELNSVILFKKCQCLACWIQRQHYLA